MPLPQPISHLPPSFLGPLLPGLSRAILLSGSLLKEQAHKVSVGGRPLCQADEHQSTKDGGGASRQPAQDLLQGQQLVEYER